MGDSGELQFIVDRLNDQPFGMNLTMVAFDEKTPFELLEVVNAVMAHLSPQHSIDLRDETPEATATRMLDFMRVLNYRPPHQLDPQQAKTALLHGEPAFIYPILTWMLQRLPELQKRAYLGRFLVNVEVPEHMFTDEEVVEVYQNYKDLQEEFKEVHKTSEKYKSQLISPTEIKKAIMQMEEDKEMLGHKVESLKTKLESIDRFEDMLEATHKLRLQQDEQVKLQDRLKEQKAQLLQAEHRLNAMGQRLNEKRAERSGNPDVKQLLGNLEAEVMELEKQALEILPQQLQQKQRRMEELQHVLSENATSEGELQQLQHQHQQLNRNVQQLEERKRQSNSNPDDSMAGFRQQANLIAKKKEAILQRLTTVGRERDQIEAELRDKAGALANVVPVLKGDDFRKYASELRGKTAQYKRMKAELSELRSEWGVVARTVALLKQQDQELGQRLGEAESRQGARGFGQAQDDLEKISQQKAEIDELKGRTLEEMSQVVGEINEKIKKRKHQLAPQIMRLRKLRTEVRDKETVYTEKKQTYNAAKAGIDSDLSAVQEESNAALKEAAHEESQAAYYESASSIERVKLNRAADEKAGRFRRTLPDGTEVTSFKQLYESKVKQQEAASKELRERQKRIKENHGGNAKQVKIFRDLYKMLRCKIEAQQRAKAELKDMEAAENQDTNIFTMPEDDGPSQSMAF
jgi:intraflagellar transport protein 81